MKYTNFRNKTIAYTHQGKGTAVVFLHGFCADSSVWDEFKPDLLEENCQVICIDLPGSGKSEVIPALPIEGMAEAVHAVVQELHLEKFILIGHSMGGYVSLAYAAKHPERLLGLGMFHSQPYPDTPEKKETRKKSIEFIGRQGHILYVKQLIPDLFPPVFVRSNAFLIEKLTFRATRFPQAGIVNALQAMKDRPDQSEVLANIQVPVLFIIGGQDTAIPAEASMEQTHLPTIATIHILEKVGHMGQFEAKKATQGMVRHFVEFCLEQKVE
ncbi:MAG: alpha/beta hydrolase [Saprospiraceae bacterium]|nr:MAG: alpha/beta hydrolase [Saprospiraceae bacterium]